MKIVQRAVAVLLLVAACAPRSAPAATPGADCIPAQGGAMRFVLADPPGVASLGGEAFTMSCRLPEQAVVRLGGGAPAMLYVEGIRLPAGRGVTVDVYVAGQDEPAGSFTLLPSARGGAIRAPVPLGSAALAAGLREERVLSITLRAVDSSDEGATPPEIGFDRVVLELN